MKNQAFAQRRKRFLNQIQGGLAYLPSAPMVIRNHDVHYPFRQDSNFFYLTGLDEPTSAALFCPQEKEAFQIYVEPRDKTKELWEGKILGPARAKTQVGADAAYPIDSDEEFEKNFLQGLCASDRLYYRVGENAARDQQVFTLMKKAMRRLGRTGRPLWPIHDPDEALGELRLIKGDDEIERMRKAGQLTADAHSAMMRFARPGLHEYEVQAQMEQAFFQAGAKRVGYGSIVASGANACVLHYTQNDRKMGAKDLLLIDAGGEFEFYTADITRTFPVGDAFTDPQREIYEAVLKTQLACIAKAKPGATMASLHETACQVITEELVRLKILKGNVDKLVKDQAFKPYFPHGTGHWLGMDVHDVGKYYTSSYNKYRPLEPGMVFTVEPGLYFGAFAPKHPRYQGIGVRIEDDIVITRTGCEVLTSGVPKEVDEVEALCQSK